MHPLYEDNSDTEDLDDGSDSTTLEADEIKTVSDFWRALRQQLFSPPKHKTVTLFFVIGKLANISFIVNLFIP